MHTSLQKGFVAMSSVLVIAIVVIAIAGTISLLSIGEGQAALALTDGEQALQLADGCIEDVGQRIIDNPNYGGGTITYTFGTCLVTINKSGNTYTVNVTATAGQYQHSIETVLNKTGNITQTSWTRK